MRYVNYLLLIVPVRYVKYLLLIAFRGLVPNNSLKLTFLIYYLTSIEFMFFEVMLVIASNLHKYCCQQSPGLTTCILTLSIQSLRLTVSQTNRKNFGNFWPEVFNFCLQYRTLLLKVLLIDCVAALVVDRFLQFCLGTSKLKAEWIDFSNWFSKRW